MNITNNMKLHELKENRAFLESQIWGDKKVFENENGYIIRQTDRFDDVEWFVVHIFNFEDPETYATLNEAMMAFREYESIYK